MKIVPDDLEGMAVVLAAQGPCDLHDEGACVRALRQAGFSLIDIAIGIEDAQAIARELRLEHANSNRRLA